MRYDYEAILTALQQELEAHRYRNTRHDLERLGSVLMRRFGVAQTYTMKVIIKSLMAAGNIKGTKYSSLRWVDTQNAEQQQSSSTDKFYTGEQLRKAREELHEQQNRNTELNRSIDTLNENLKAADERYKELEQKKEDSKVLEVVVKQGAKKRKLDGHFHKKFPQLVALAQARKNIFIYGPTGSGKSYVCSQLAESLGLPYYFVSCTAGMSEGVLGGRLLPIGKQGTFEYVLSEFINAYENGGVFLLDEIDAADPNVLLLVNAALANGKMCVPNRPNKPYATKHKDFICIAAANTVGTGGDRMYSGRNKLDAATLDRFLIGKVYFDYDQMVEKELCPDEELRSKLWKIRDGINAHRLERAMSSRLLQDAYDMKEAGWGLNEILDAYFCGWRDDEKNKVLTYVAQN